MASGFGFSGGTSAEEIRRHMQKLLDCARISIAAEVLACYLVNTNAESQAGARKCKPALEDYYECLHHGKEAAKVSAMQIAYRKRELSTARDEAPNAGQVRSLGLLDAKHEEIDLKHGKLLPTFKGN